MGIFRDYESAGSGIAKNAPKKEGFALFIDLLGRKLWKLLELNLLYFIFFIPLYLIFPALTIIKNGRIFTGVAFFLVFVFMVFIGPATAGMMKVQRAFYIEKHTFVARDFFKAVKANFKKASVIGFIDCIIALSAIASINVYPTLAVIEGTKLMYIPMVITFSLFLTVAIMNFYIFLMLIATNLSLKDLFKNSFALAFLGMKQNIIAFAVSAVLTVGMYLLLKFAFPLFMMVIPFFPSAFMFFVICFVCYPVIQKYVINPYYAGKGEINPELINDSENVDEETLFKDMGGKEKPIEKRSKGKGKRIS